MPGPEERPKGFVARVKATQSRTILLLVVGLVLAMMVWGPLRACSGVEVDEDEAIATAVQEIDFQPERTEARLLRQGTGTAWIVVFTIKDPDGGRDDFLRHVTVRIHPTTGAVIDVTDRSPT